MLMMLVGLSLAATLVTTIGAICDGVLVSLKDVVWFILLVNFILATVYLAIWCFGVGLDTVFEGLQWR